MDIVLNHASHFVLMNVLFVNWCVKNKELLDFSGTFWPSLVEVPLNVRVRVPFNCCYKFKKE